MAFFEMISKEEYVKGVKFKPHKYGKLYEELQGMKEGQCARKECDSKEEARIIKTSIGRTFARNGDDRFEITVRKNIVYIRRVK